jgi:chromosome segregation ATPase
MKMLRLLGLLAVFGISLGIGSQGEAQANPQHKAKLEEAQKDLAVRQQRLVRLEDVLGNPDHYRAKWTKELAALQAQWPEEKLREISRRLYKTPEYDSDYRDILNLAKQSEKAEYQINVLKRELATLPAERVKKLYDLQDKVKRAQKRYNHHKQLLAQSTGRANK